MDYEIELKYFKPDRLRKKDFKNVYSVSKGDFVCEISIRNFIPKDLISNLAKKDTENPQKCADNYGRKILATLELFLSPKVK